MEEYYLNKYQNKSKIELQRIIDNKDDYQLDAVKAAAKLLNVELNEPAVPIAYYENSGAKDRKLKNDRISRSFNFYPFFRSLSYREFMTVISIALVYLAICEILEYYSDERFFQDSYQTWKLYTFLFSFLANHIFYKIEHHRSNNFIGRSINDLLLLIAILLTQKTYAFLLGNSYSFSTNSSFLGEILMLFLLPFFIFSFEILIGILKVLFRKIKWQIL